MSQLDLFVHFLPPAKVIPFPLARRVALARGIAAELGALSFDAGKRHWRSVSTALRIELRKEGMAPRAIKVEIEDLAAAVHSELRRLSLPKKLKKTATVVSLEGKRTIQRGGDCGGEADAKGGQGDHPLGRVWERSSHSEPFEYDAVRVRDGDDAA